MNENRNLRTQNINMRRGGAEQGTGGNESITMETNKGIIEYPGKAGNRNKTRNENREHKN